MVNPTVRRSFGGVADALEDTEPVAILAIMGVIGAGILVGQEWSDFVLPQLNMPVEPTTMSQLGVSALVKTVGAALLVILGTAMGGVGLVLTGGVAAGMLGLAGADVLNVLQRGTPVPGSQPSRGVPQRRSRARAPRVPRARSTGSAGGSTAQASYSY